ncbi:von Willebrand factor A domain-containing protein 8, partial [Nowakowskiella sp. JEL0078]
PDAKEQIAQAYQRFGILSEPKNIFGTPKLRQVSPSKFESTFPLDDSTIKFTILANSHSHDSRFSLRKFIPTNSTNRLLAAMCAAHSLGDFCLLGPKSCGKTALLSYFFAFLNLTAEYIPLHKDVTTRELLQRRNTDDRGNTVWVDSALLTAMKLGHVVVLDSIERLRKGVLSSLQRLLEDREVSGGGFAVGGGGLGVSEEKYRMLENKIGREELNKRGIWMVHPGFRVVAVARIGSSDGWLTEEILTMFRWVYMPELEKIDEKEVVMGLVPGVDSMVVDQLVEFKERVIMEKDSNLEDCVSTRQLIRIARRTKMFSNDF